MKSARTEGKAKKRIFVPSDFREIIQYVPDECPMVGGQAVAWWAQRFEAVEKPITSCDIDFWGFRADLQTLAKALRKKPVYPGKYEMTLWVGGVPLLINGEETIAEFINSIPGLDVLNPEKASVCQVLADVEPKKQVLILSPVSLVLAKLYALRAFDQRGRQDEIHLKISLISSNCFIAELLHEGKIRPVLWNIERLIAASQLKAYQRLENEHGFSVLSAIPLVEIEKAAASESVPEKDRNSLRQFLSVRWPRANLQQPEG